MRAWKPSKAKAREFAQTMETIAGFCAEHGIEQSRTGDSYYFTLNGKRYRVSNHTVETSNAVRRECGLELYHANGREQDTIYITASKTRIIDIYKALADGKELDGRGYVKE